MKFAKLALQAAIFSSVPSAVSSQFVPYTTEIDIYLNPKTSGGDDVADTRWTYTSAVSQKTLTNDCAGLRDFIFTCGWYGDPDDPPFTVTPPPPPGRFPPANGWICSASNNSVGDPLDINIRFDLPDTAGWYKFRHTHRVVNGALSVDFEIIDSSNTVLKTWTRSDPTDTPDKLAGNRYNWFPRLGCRTPFGNGLCTTVDSTFRLAFDNSKKCIIGVGCDFFQGFESDTAGWDEPFEGSIINRVESDTRGITSSSGAWHAEATPGAFLGSEGRGPFSRVGGFCKQPAANLCPGTPDGALVDDNGCSDEQVDEDGDGVCNPGAKSGGPSDCDDNNGIGDLCPGTPEDAIVDENGCSDNQVDEDGDGVCNPGAPSGGPNNCNNDNDDLCPGTPEDAVVDENGCSDDQKEEICMDVSEGKKQSSGKGKGKSTNKKIGKNGRQANRGGVEEDWMKL